MKTSDASQKQNNHSPIAFKPWLVLGGALGVLYWISRRENRLSPPVKKEIMPPKDLDDVDRDSWDSFPASDPPGHF